MKRTLLFLTLLGCMASHAQEERSAKMGQATKDELQIRSYDKDPSAKALILYDEVNYYFSNYKKRIFNRDYYQRIKILSNDALDWGTSTFSIGDGFEILMIEAITYNLDENGNIVTSHFDAT